MCKNLQVSSRPGRVAPKTEASEKAPAEKFCWKRVETGGASLAWPAAGRSRRWPLLEGGPVKGARPGTVARCAFVCIRDQDSWMKLCLRFQPGAGGAVKAFINCSTSVGVCEVDQIAAGLFR